MINQDLIELEHEDTENSIRKLELAREKLNSSQTLSESDFNSEDVREWINLNNKFIEEKLSIAYSIDEEETSSLRFYKFEKPVLSFEGLPLTKEEERALAESIDGEMEFNKRGEY